MWIIFATTERYLKLEPLRVPLRIEGFGTDVSFESRVSKFHLEVNNGRWNTLMDKTCEFNEKGFAS